MPLNASSHSQTVFSIAGSDPSGGAGIQADIKTCAVLGVYSCAAITCLTAQNTQGVTSYLPVDPSFVKKQINLILEDIQPTHIKIGMVGNDEIAMAIGECLDTFQKVVVYDPVLKASSGQSLFGSGNIHALSSCIIAKATILTPNTKELQALTQLECDDTKSIVQAAQYLLDTFPNLAGMVVTGGHLEEQSDLITDFLFLKDTANGLIHKTATHPRIRSTNTHGTGCTFSSAFAAYHLLTDSYEKAFDNAVSLLQELITASCDKPIGHGSGPLLHHLHSVNN